MSGTKYHFPVERMVGTLDEDFAFLIVAGKGTARLRFRNGVADMADFHVQPEFRRVGVGTAIYQEALRMAYEREALSLAFLVGVTNFDAIAFYRKMGAQAFYCDGRNFWMAHLVNRLNGRKEAAPC